MTPPDLAGAMPTRPLALSPPVSGWGVRVAGVLLLLLAAGGLWYGGAGEARVLVDDWSMRGRAVPVPGRVSGNCRTRVLLVQSCRLTVTAGTAKDGLPVRGEFDYTFLDPGLGRYTVTPMADPARPGSITTDLGQDNLVVRTITAALLAVVMLLIGFGGAVLLFGSNPAKRRLRAISGRRLTAVPARVVRGDAGWAVAPLDGRGTVVWPLPRKAEPFWLDRAGGVALAVAAPGSEPFPLDAALGWADLTPEERARLRAVAAPA